MTKADRLGAFIGDVQAVGFLQGCTGGDSWLRGGRQGGVQPWPKAVFKISKQEEAS